MTTIRKDQRGLYAKVGGYIFRPVFPAGYNHVYEDSTEYSKGDKVRAHHPGGPLGKVGDETWYAHGAYMGGAGDPNSENHYKPDYDNWRN